LANGDPATVPPIFTETVDAAAAGNEAAMKLTKHATETSANSHDRNLAWRLLSHMAGESGRSVFNLEAKRPAVFRDNDPVEGAEPYPLPGFIRERENNVTRSPEAMPLVRRQEGDTLLILGPGAVDSLRTLLTEFGATRPYLVTGPHLASGRVGDRVKQALGTSLVGMYARSRPHVPDETAREVVDGAQAARADVLVGLGGGSPIGTAKAAAFRLQQIRGSGPPCRVAAVPTTYAGSEVTPVFGTTDPERGRKTVIRSDPIRPRLALYDPELAVDTPPDLSASTGVNALAHCVEALYAKDASDAERAMALRAAGRIVEYLPRVVKEPRDLLIRYRMFEGSMEAGLVLAKAGMGAHHGICHVLGGRYNAPHGVLNGIILPHAMRFNIPIAAKAYRTLAPVLRVRADGVDDGALGESVCNATAELIRGLGLSQRLRDLGISKADLPSIAEEALESKSVRANPRPVTREDALGILQAAW
jgi:maleylacetate reductase